MSDSDLLQEKEFSAQEQNELRIVHLGLEAESFAASELFKYLINKSTVETEGLMAELIAADPSDVKENMRIRTELKLYMFFEEWIRELISSGSLAEHNLRAMDDTLD